MPPNLVVGKGDRVEVFSTNPGGLPYNGQPAMENPRETLGRFVRSRLEALNLSQADFCRNLSRRLKRPAETYLKYVQRVLSGEKPIPEPKVRAWGAALSLYQGEEDYRAFAALAAAARAWGKTDGRAYLDVMTEENRALREEIQHLSETTRQLEEQVRKLSAALREQ